MTYELPVNPISHIILTLKVLNVTDEGTLAEVLERLEKIEVLYQGAAVYSISGADLFALNMLLVHDVPFLSNQVVTDNATRWLSLIIPFGRKTFLPDECFHATHRGELLLQITDSGTATAVDGLIYQIEVVELPEARPTAHLKVTTLTKTPTATGEHDVDLPINNDYVGILIYGTTKPTGIVWTASFDWVKILANNEEYDYAHSYWECLRGDMINRVGHRQPYDLEIDNDVIKHYGYLDFDPREDKNFLLETRGLSDLTLRTSADVADAIRVLPVELPVIGGAAAGAR
ncbi:MAG: hypothetical protein KAX16_08015 [Actinomycetia bacterium]|nr:hypothetical protein [Actinomycetes bacterium]